MMDNKKINKKDLEILRLKASVQALKEFFMNQGDASQEEKESMMRVLNQVDMIARNTVSRNIADLSLMIGENEFERWIKKELSDISVDDIKESILGESPNTTVVKPHKNKRIRDIGVQSDFGASKGTPLKTTIDLESVNIDESGKISPTEKDNIMGKILDEDEKRKYIIYKFLHEKKLTNDEIEFLYYDTKAISAEKPTYRKYHDVWVFMFNGGFSLHETKSEVMKTYYKFLKENK